VIIQVSKKIILSNSLKQKLPDVMQIILATMKGLLQLNTDFAR